ncbi:hypothetical protein HUW51_00695 (plasmid) [Adhaeribacter swui]|uniref:TIGR04255 family protein n=1 Tax=Adhaeribacter swui TaxID=2086471 RepID=A0A7G7G2C5_9BACT|nr:hypothetical protein [Adhaeribacter swui]QNF31309.1 hypothetical protein HUW51_00695 [Adhaeribacter swui]
MDIKEKLQISVTNIVLIGDFNPIIFQPAWLASKGLIRENEADSVNLELIHKELVRYRLDWAELEITDNRFYIQTSKEAYQEAIRDLVLGIFKTFLKETPIRALGINHLLHYQLTEKEYINLGDKLVPLNNWNEFFKDPRILHVEVLESQRLDNNNGYYRVNITPSDLLPRNGIIINLNDHYSLKNQERGTQGEIIKILEDSWDSSLTMANDISEYLWKKVQQ